MMKKIGTGRTAEVFLTEEGRALKLFYEGYPEQAVAQEVRNAVLAQEKGLPVPQCFGRRDTKERYGILYECVTGESLLQRILRTGDVEYAAKTMALLHRRFLSQEAAQATDIRLWLKAELSRAQQTHEICAALQLLEKMPDGNALLHGDFHPDNIQVDGDKVWVLDWMNLCRGDARYDLARTYCLLVDAPLLPGLDEGAAESVLKMRRVLAQGYLDAMGVPYEALADWLRIVRAQIGV